MGKTIKTVWFLIKAFIHFVYVLITSLLGKEHTYILQFVKEDDRWYIDMPDWPFAKGRLEMVSGADDLCEYLSYLGNEGKLRIKVTTSNKDTDKLFIHYDVIGVREWAYLKWGGQYNIPKAMEIPIEGFWLCQVTLFVLGWWPKYIYINKINGIE